MRVNRISEVRGVTPDRPYSMPYVNRDTRELDELASAVNTDAISKNYTPLIEVLYSKPRIKDMLESLPPCTPQNILEITSRTLPIIRDAITKDGNFRRILTTELYHKQGNTYVHSK